MFGFFLRCDAIVENLKWFRTDSNSNCNRKWTVEKINFWDNINKNGLLLFHLMEIKFTLYIASVQCVYRTTKVSTVQKIITFEPQIKTRNEIHQNRSYLSLQAPIYFSNTQINTYLYFI